MLFFDVGGYSGLCDEYCARSLQWLLFFDVGGYSKPGDRDSPDCLRRLPLVEFEGEEEEEEWKEDEDSEEISKRLDNVYCVMREDG